MKQLSVKRLTMAAMIAALIFVMTRLSIPLPIGGYLHLGDSLVFFAAILVGPLYGFLAAGIGSALADILGGYAMYAIPTFFIKGIMTLIVYFGFSYFHSKTDSKPSKLSSILMISLTASTVMVFGYFATEVVLYSFWSAIGNVPFNIMQGVASSALSVILITPIEMVKVYSQNS